MDLLEIKARRHERQAPRAVYESVGLEAMVWLSPADLQLLRDLHTPIESRDGRQKSDDPRC